jgi:membrane dipeptidase
MIPLFDLHCDTLGKMSAEGYDFNSSPLHISLDKCNNFNPYIQVMALWSDCRKTSNEAYSSYKKALSYAKKQEIIFSNNKNELSKKPFILAIEDGRIVEDDLSRVEEFKNDGVKLITLCWSGVNSICGGWNTNEGLYDFGVAFVKKCFDCGIIPDVSHCSVKTIKETIELAFEYNKTIIASHSNSYAVCSHDRNLRDEEFVSISNLGGIVGISLAPQHLAKSGDASIKSILNHIDHYLSIGGENTVSLGCDFDGVDKLPIGINNISDLSKLYKELTNYFGETIADKIFYSNAFNFFSKWM